MSIKTLLNSLLALGIVAAIAAFFLYFVDPGTVIQQLRRADWRYLVLACVAFLGGLYTYGLRWWALLDRKPGPIFTFHAANIGHMLNIVIPFRLGEAGRIVVMGQHERVTTTEATSSFVLERVFEQVMRILALVVAIMLGTNNRFTEEALAGGILFLLAAIVAISWVIRRREVVLYTWPDYLARLPRVSVERARQILTEWLDNLTTVATPRLLTTIFFWSVVNWGFFWAFHYFSLQALHLPLTPREMQVVSLISLATAPPSASTQPVIYHASIVGPLFLAGFEEEPMTSYAIVLHALQLLWMLPLGLWGLSKTGFSTRRLLNSSRALKETRG